MKYLLAAVLLFLAATPALSQTEAPPPQIVAAPATPAPETAPETTPETPLPADPAAQTSIPSLETPNAAAEILLTKDSDINDADKVSLYIDMMRNNVRACINTRQAEAKECQCKFPNSLDNLKTAYTTALRFHPDWNGKVVSYKKGTAPAVSISFGGLKNQMDTCDQINNAK